MGTIHHHAIIITSCNRDAVERAHDKALSLMPHVSNVVDGVVNGQRSFAILPDGSKEYWLDSNNADIARGEFIEWMRQEDRVDYAAVSFGELSPTFDTNCRPLTRQEEDR